jgi:hypothetical protein
MEDQLQQQMVNELCHLLKKLNETYKDFFHCKLLTIVDLKEDTCEDCVEKHKACYRCVVGFKEPEVKEESPSEHSSD